jgi:site-specific recombinase XerD
MSQIEKATSAPLTRQDAGREIAARREQGIFESMSADMQAAVMNAAIGQRLIDELNHQADLAMIDYQKDKERFLSAAKIKSGHTHRAYMAAFDRLESWAACRSLSVVEMRTQDADDWCLSLRADGRAVSSVRRDIAAISSFFTQMERWHERLIYNPFRGTKSRPKKENDKKACAYPDRKEVSVIMSALDPVIRAAVAVMAYRGLRVGGLPSLSIRAGRFTTRSKGKDISGEMTKPALEAIKEAGLPLAQPFAGLTEKDITNRLFYAIGKLAAAGRIRARYSPHDFRHLYAMTQYEKDHDIYRLKELLGHASIAVTENYLKGLGAI